jgi:hypothetical protein
VCVGRVPDGTGSRRGVILLHTHTLLLQTLAGECIDSGRLRDLSSSFKNPLTVLVGGSNTDDEVAIMHSGMFDSDGDFISGKDHSDNMETKMMKGEVATRTAQG